MSEKAMYAKIRKITFGLMGVTSLLMVIVFHNDPIPYVLGIILGGLMGIISFNMIIKMTSQINEYNAVKLAVGNYFMRFLGVGLVFFVAVSEGINVFTLLVGFLCSKIAIQVYAQLERRGMHG
ncbi:MAG: ATP synthase subunit I [Erysipelotrichaceae bacterium]